jgi:RNA polymerase sigma-70 factor (ECF subfamily)
LQLTERNPHAMGRRRRARLESSCREEHSTADVAAREFSDEELLLQVRNGDRPALALLFRRHAPVVRSVCSKVLRDEGEADDLLQDVFLYIFHHAGAFDPSKGEATSWIVQMAYHRAFDRRRYLTARRFYSSEALQDDLVAKGSDHDAEQRIVQKITAQNLLKRFREALTPEQCCTPELFFFQGYTLREIADETGMSHGSVRHHYYRGLERLRCLLSVTI